MVLFINKFQGNKMWVTDERAEEYRKAGHKPASGVVGASEDTGEEEIEKDLTGEPVKRGGPKKG